METTLTYYHLGSWTTITDDEGNIEQELSFDAWGSLRNAEQWNCDFSGVPMFDRGFTGHEHLYDFGLINMNGRMYDPVMSSFLSVDSYVQSPENSQNFNRYAYCLNNPLKYTDPDGETFITAAVIITGALIGAYTGGALANDGNYNIAEWDSPGTAAGIIFGGVAGALSSWCAGAIAGTGISFCNTIAMASSSLVYSSGMYATGMLAGFDYDITLNLGVGSISYSPNDGEWNGGSLFDFEHNEWQDYVSYGLGLASNLTDLHRFATWGCLSKAKKLEIIKENLSDKSIKVTYDRTISGEGDYNKSTNEIRIGRKGLRRGKGWANSTIEHENQHSVDRNKGLGKKDNDLLDFRAYNEELRYAEENGLSPAQHQELIKRSKDCANNLGLKTGAYPKYTLKEWLRSFLLR